MALFGNKDKETKEDKAERKQRAMLEKYGLQALSNPEDIASVKTIVSELAGTGLMEAGLALGAGNDRDIQKTQLAYQRTLVEQNFIMIRQLDRIASLLENK